MGRESGAGAWREGHTFDVTVLTAGYWDTADNVSLVILLNLSWGCRLLGDLNNSNLGCGQKEWGTGVGGGPHP